MSDSFFAEPREQSLVKAAIVSKYFWSWAKIMVPQARRRNIARIAYADLFCGRGHYEDGTKSTPLLVLEKVIAEPEMRNMLATYFNDANPSHVASLETAIKSLPGVETLRYPPEFSTSEIDQSVAKAFTDIKMVPTLTFIDPVGYKGVSLDLIEAVIKDWGCECVLFFNYNRINMGLENQYVEPLMDSLFGTERADRLRGDLALLSPSQRELTIVEEISQAFKEKGVRYVSPFRFKNDSGTRTSHYLIFLSKSPLGYGIMKEVMAGESSRATEGVASFEYCKADSRQQLLFRLSQSLDDLGEHLCDNFAGQTLLMRDVFEQHNIDTPFVEKNYKDALRRLESDEKILTDPPAYKRQRRNGQVTFSDKVIVTFPRRD
ncbi:MAG: three-Cys-motif partner protein TcmP [Thermomicrobiales bacterium]